MGQISPINRFSKRVENYLISRPAYPEDLYAYIQKHTKIETTSKIVDVGSGTGLLSQLFLNQGHKIWAIEPNLEMRLAGEKYYKTNARFISYEGSAENIPLPGEFANLIIAGQAFHWFDSSAFLTESKRVLIPGGHVALVWNEWFSELSPFLKEYEALLQEFGTDYKQVSRQNEKVLENIHLFFASHDIDERKFINDQSFSFIGLKSRLLSSSYVPLETNPKFQAMINKLKTIFEAHKDNGIIKFDYITRLYLGSIH